MLNNNCTKEHNIEGMKQVLKRDIMEEIDLPIELETQWVNAVASMKNPDDLIAWCDDNVMNLTIDEYVIIFNTVCIYKAILDRKPQVNLREFDEQSSLRYYNMMTLAVGDLPF